MQQASCKTIEEIEDRTANNQCKGCGIISTKGKHGCNASANQVAASDGVGNVFQHIQIQKKKLTLWVQLRDNGLIAGCGLPHRNQHFGA